MLVKHKKRLLQWLIKNAVPMHDEFNVGPIHHVRTTWHLPVVGPDWLSVREWAYLRAVLSAWWRGKDLDKDIRKLESRLKEEGETTSGHTQSNLL